MPRLKPTDFDAWETVRSVPATSLSRLSQLFVHSRALRRLRANTFRGTKRWSGCTTLVTTVCNDFVRRLPGAHALRMLKVVLVSFCDFDRTRSREALLLT